MLPGEVAQVIVVGEEHPRDAVVLAVQVVEADERRRPQAEAELEEARQQHPQPGPPAFAERDDDHIGELQLAELLLAAQMALQRPLALRRQEEREEQDHLAADPLPDIVEHRQNLYALGALARRHVRSPAGWFNLSPSTATPCHSASAGRAHVSGPGVPARSVPRGCRRFAIGAGQIARIRRTTSVNSSADAPRRRRANGMPSGTARPASIRRRRISPRSRP